MEIEILTCQSLNLTFLMIAIKVILIFSIFLLKKKLFTPDCRGEEK